MPSQENPTISESPLASLTSPPLSSHLLPPLMKTEIQPKSFPSPISEETKGGIFLQMMGTLASLILVFSPTVGNANNYLLGVVRSPDNASEWNQITTRLQSSGIGYQAIDLKQINSAEDLAAFKVLFLPNVETIDSNQVDALDTWVKQGGRLIVSGYIGRSSAPQVRQNLRSLLGAYWAFPLTQPTSPEPYNRGKDFSGKNPNYWIPNQPVKSTVFGGVLIPSDINSQTAATWKQSAGSSAVITTDKVVYLGWKWGQGNANDIDTNWLRASVTYHQGDIVTSPTALQANIPLKPNFSPSFPSPFPTPINNQSKNNPIALNVPPPSLLNPLKNTANFLLSPTVYKPLSPNESLIPDTFIDPSNQSAPAGLDVQANNEPINTLEAFLMRQELTNLLGRFESALIASNSANTSINLKATNFNNLVAARNPAIASRPSVISPIRLSAISQAREVLKQFDNLIRQQDYSTARQKWLQARQLLWQNYPMEGQRAGAEIRAVWLDRGTIVKARSERDLAIIFDRLADAGINTVFFETFNAGYPIYPSRVAPQQNPLTLGWDPLEISVKLAHERGMELHAWLWAFGVGNKRHNKIINKPDNYLGPIVTEHPEWANIDNKGNIFHQHDGKVYLDPANREVRSFLLRLVGEIASRYQVDGIQLDYIRYPFQDPNAGFSYGYGKAAREEFQQLTGVDPLKLGTKGGELWEQWTQFKTNKITSFVADVSQLLRKSYPHLILSVAVFPHPEHQRIYKIQQHWEEWARQGIVDLIVPMTYALDTNRFQRISQPLTQEKALGSSLIAPGVKLLEIPEIVAIDQIQAARDLSTGGYAIFAFETINNNLQGYLNRTQGHSTTRSTSANEPIPYREPFAAAASRYKVLKQEWSFLLENNLLNIHESELQKLRAQADDLAKAFNQLSANPSIHNLENTRLLFQAFKSEFPHVMRRHAIDNSYQVQTWQNRLDSLEMLLRYGERVQLSKGNR
jgi:uncharacterized lipoprotein YddW (UPF0748 family)